MVKNKILSVLASTILIASAAFSAETKNESSTLPTERDTQNLTEAKPSFGLMLGTFVPDDGSVATTNIGIDFMIQPRIPFSFGFEATHSEPESNTSGNRLKHTALLAKAHYNFGGTNVLLRHSYAGVGAGVQLQESNSKFAAATIVGFDIPLKNEDENVHLSLGANAKYLYVDGTGDVNSNAVSLNGVFKFWY